MNIFEHENYKEFINNWIRLKPKKGRGESKRISELLRVHSTMMSHILRGSSHLSLEQASELAQYMGLSDLETDYLFELVLHDRAGTAKLREKIKVRIQSLRKRALQLKERLKNEQKTLSETDRAIFYSSWHYSAIRLLSTLEETNVSEVREKLMISHRQLNEAVHFLTRVGLCTLTSSGKLRATPSLTHLGADSAHIWKHHQSWRIKAMSRYFDLEDEEIMYSAPLTISLKDMAIIRERIIRFIEELKKTVEASQPDRVACLNIDWFKVAT
jgi:uncharacterized protein (TIGR02147 family)